MTSYKHFAKVHLTCLLLLARGLTRDFEFCANCETEEAEEEPTFSGMREAMTMAQRSEFQVLLTNGQAVLLVSKSHQPSQKAERSDWSHGSWWEGAATPPPCFVSGQTWAHPHKQHVFTLSRSCQLTRGRQEKPRHRVWLTGRREGGASVKLRPQPAPTVPPLHLKNQENSSRRLCSL